MENQSQKSVYPDSTKNLLYRYQILGSKLTMTERLTQLLMTTNSAYYIMEKEAANITQERGRNRSVSSDRIGRLMNYQYTPETDKEVEELSLEFITSAINGFLDHYKEMPTDESVYKMIKVLFVQIIVNHGLDLLSDIHVPDYIQPMMDKAEEFLNTTADNIFIDWLQEMEKLGNSHLIPYLESVGPVILASLSKSDASVNWNTYMQNYLTQLKNPEESYNSYLSHRLQYGKTNKKIQQSDIIPIFELTADEFRHGQLRLYDTFKNEYMNDLNSQYLKKLINGIED